MSEAPKPSSQGDPQALAEACAEVMWTADTASRKLGMKLEKIGPGTAIVSLTISQDMANGHGTCHGGYIFTLADSAFAFACNSHGGVAVAQHCVITYIRPAHAGDSLTAVAREVSRSGRNAITDVSVTNQDGVQVAEFRGHSRTLHGKHIVPAA